MLPRRTIGPWAAGRDSSVSARTAASFLSKSASVLWKPDMESTWCASSAMSPIAGRQKTRCGRAKSAFRWRCGERMRGSGTGTSAPTAYTFPIAGRACWGTRNMRSRTTFTSGNAFFTRTTGSVPWTRFEGVPQGRFVRVRVGTQAPSQRRQLSLDPRPGRCGVRREPPGVSHGRLASGHHREEAGDGDAQGTRGPVVGGTTDSRTPFAPIRSEPARLRHRWSVPSRRVRCGGLLRLSSHGGRHAWPGYRGCERPRICPRAADVRRSEPSPRAGRYPRRDGRRYCIA